MQRRLATIVPVAVAAVGLALGMIAGPIMADTRPGAIPSTAGAARSAGGAASSGGTWGTAREVPGVTAIDPAVRVARAWSVSCASPGNCAAGGNSGDQAFLVDETDGSWGTARKVPGLAALGTGATAMVSSVSCGSAGNCAAGGYYDDSFGHEQAFVVDETGGSWDTAQEVPGTRVLNTKGAEVLSVSCTSAGNCAAGGYYEGSFPLEQAFVVNETNGSWGTAQAVPGMAALGGEGSGVNSVSCASAGNCAAAGRYQDSSGGGKAFVVDETRGFWGAAQEVPGLAALNTRGNAGVYSVSCSSPGNCAAGGYYQESSGPRQAFVADETEGSWGAAQEVPGSAALNARGNAGVYSVSCSSPGNCAAGGDYEDSSADSQAFVVDETAGSWRTAQEVPGTPALNAGPANLYNATVRSVSCSSPGNCAAVGYLEEPSRQMAFVANEMRATSTSLSLSPAGVSYGDERAERASVTVSSAAGTPPGTVTVRSGATPVCTITLSSGTGTCAPPAALFPAGIRQLTATYGGSADFAASTSATKSLTIARAATQTGLALSAASVVYGDEQAEQVSVAVSPQYSGTPDGTVTVFDGPAAVCTIRLSSGKGTCTLPATRFPARTVRLTAAYGGSANFAASTSAIRSLTFGQADTTTALTLASARVSYGNEQAEQATVTVSPQYGGTPAGTVTVNSGSRTICTITLASAAGSCAIPSTALPAGTARLTATYNGDPDFARSVSAATALTVAQAATQTSVALSAASVVYGDEQAEHVSASVTSPAGTLHGTVTVLDGPAAVCTITLSSDKGTCTLSATQFPAGTVQLTATYGGSANFAPSASLATALTIVAGPTTTTLALSAASVTYGNEQAAQATVTVSPRYGGTPTGTVTVNSGSTTICTITLASAAGSCAIPATALPAGTAQLTATYNGDLDFARSVSAAKTLSVARAASSTALSLSTAKVTYGNEQGERLSVTVRSMYGVTPAGTVAVKSGASTVCTITLASGQGSCLLAATTLPAGTQHLTAAYGGSVDVTASASAAASLSVAKAGTRSALSLSASKVTYGREQGERLTVAVTSQYSGTPTGKVAIKAGAVTICTITLASGRGTCILTPSRVRPDSYALHAYYAGSSDFGGSASAGKALTVVR
jgi:hypothetical protein